MKTYILGAHGAMRNVAEDEARHRRHLAEYDTTRRHPRTLAEAFPDVRAPALVMPPRRAPVLTRYSVTAALVLVAVVALIAWR